MLHVIETFYLFRLLIRFRIEFNDVISAEDVAETSGDLTKLVTNNQPWLSVWIRDKLLVLAQLLDEIDKSGNTRFFLKGGRAIKYLEGNPQQGENDWDTQILINPNLPAEVGTTSSCASTTVSCWRCSRSGWKSTPARPERRGLPAEPRPVAGRQPAASTRPGRCARSPARAGSPRRRCGPGRRRTARQLPRQLQGGTDRHRPSALRYRRGARAVGAAAQQHPDRPGTVSQSGPALLHQRIYLDGAGGVHWQLPLAAQGAEADQAPGPTVPLRCPAPPPWWRRRLVSLRNRRRACQRTARRSPPGALAQDFAMLGLG